MVPSFIRMSALPGASKEDYLIMSHWVWHPTDHGQTVQQGSSLPYPAPSFPRGKQRLTDGCHELHISCPFSFSSHQACKAQEALSLEEGAGQPPQLPQDYGSISFLPFPRSWWRPAQQPHLKRQERQYCQGQKNITTQVEKRGLGHCPSMQHSRAATVCCLALLQLFAELGTGEGTIPDGSTPQTHVFSLCPCNLGCISSSAFLVSPIPDSLFFLGSCMWCCNEDSVLKKSYLKSSFKMIFQDDFSTEKILWIMPILPGSKV